MSKTVCIVVLCPNGKREQIKVTPNSSILQVLEEACKKQILNPEDYDICHSNKPLDLSLPIRFANLPNNALLELNPIKILRVESMITVGLQLESGERLMKEFLPSSSLWDVVEQCLSLRSEVLDDAGGEPVCIYMHQQVTGDALRNTTLRSLGLTKGKAIIRLLYRQQEELLSQAHVSSPLSKQPFENMPNSPREHDASILNSPSHEIQARKQPRLELNQSTLIPSISNSDNCTNIAKPLDEQRQNGDEALKIETDTVTILEPTPNESEKLDHTKFLSEMPVKVAQDDVMETNEAEENIETEEIGSINYIGERDAVVYNLDDITDVKKADLPDEFFELTISDVKYLMKGYKETRLELENQPLMISAQRKSKYLKQLAYYQQTVIRVYFPEKLVLQATFKVEETAQSVINFIRNFLENKELDFYLYVTPPKAKLALDRTLLEAELVPAAIVYFGCEAVADSYLIKDLRNKVSDPRAAALAASNSRKKCLPESSLDISNSAIEDSASVENVITDSVPDTNSVQQPITITRTSSEKVPKWLKLSK